MMLEARDSPAIDPVLFPDTPLDAPFWTSSPIVASAAHDAWAVWFDHGETWKGTQKISHGYARCVR
jgi:hypothetical protein